jgi:hypothetical protein
MIDEMLGAACGLYCGWCPLYINTECKGCGRGDKVDCKIYKCCRVNKNLQFCSLCADFPCETYGKYKCLHPDWVEELKKHPVKTKD